MMPPPDLAPWQWAAVLLAAFCTGLSKTGISGIGIVSVALFPLLLPAREAVGTTLLIFISADFVAVASYRRDAEWGQLIKLAPWTLVGVLLGYVAVGRISDGQIKQLIGTILLGLALFQIVQRIRAARKPVEDIAHDAPPMPFYLSALTGIVAGFTTMVANAAGPIMVLYLLSMRLPKKTFVGTAAWFFLAVNLFKLPFNLALGSINTHTFQFAIWLFPAALVGGLMGRLLLKYINQKLFELLALALTLAAGLRLLF